MSYQEEEKNTQDDTQINNKQPKTPVKFNNNSQFGQNNYQYGEMEKVMMDKLRKTSSTFSFRDEGLPVYVQDDAQYDQSFEKNEISVTPCKSPLNMSDNIPYDLSDIGIPQGLHNLGNSLIKNNPNKILDSPSSNQNQSANFKQNNSSGGGYYTEEQKNTPQLNGRYDSDIHYQQVENFNPIISRNQIQNDNDINKRDIQIEQKLNINNINQDISQLQQKQYYSTQTTEAENVRKIPNQQRQYNSVEQKYQDEILKQEIKNEQSQIDQLEQEQYDDVQRNNKQIDNYNEENNDNDNVQNEYHNQNDRQYNDKIDRQYNDKNNNIEQNENRNNAIKIINNQEIEIINSKQDLDNNYWESNSQIHSQIDVIPPPPPSQNAIISNNSLNYKDNDKNEYQQQQLQNDQHKIIQSIPQLNIQYQNQQIENNNNNLLDLKQSDIKKPNQYQNETNNNFLNIQQNADFLYSSQQTTPREHSPITKPNQRTNMNQQNNNINSNINQQIQNRNTDTYKIYQEFLKKERTTQVEQQQQQQQQQQQLQPQIQEEVVAHFGASDYSSLPLQEDDSIIGENNYNQNQNNTFISNNMSTILQHLNNPQYNNNEQYIHSQNTQNNTNQIQSYNQNNQTHQHPQLNQKNQQISEFNSNNQQNRQSNQNQGLMNNYFPSGLIGSREIAATESYMPTPDQSFIQQSDQRNNFQKKQALNQKQDNSINQGYRFNSIDNNNDNQQPLRLSQNQINDNRNINEIQNDQNNQRNKDYWYNQNQDNHNFLNQSRENINPNEDLMAKMFQNFIAMNSNNQLPQQQQQQQFLPILNNTNNNNNVKFNAPPQYDSYNYQKNVMNGDQFSLQEDQFKNQQQMEFFNQQHQFVMNIMNFYEFHLKKMKQIAMEKTQELIEKDRIIGELQNNKQDFSSQLQQNLITLQEEIRILKQKEKRLDLLLDQTKEDYEFQIHDLKDENNQLIKSKEYLQDRQKELQTSLQKEIDKNLELNQTLDLQEQKYLSLKRDKDILEDNLNEIIQNLKLDIKSKDKKIIDSQSQIQILQSKINRMNDEKQQQNTNIIGQNNSSFKKENQQNKSFDDLYYKEIKDEIYDNTYNKNSYNQYKERGQRSQYGDLLKEQDNNSGNGNNKLKQSYDDRQIKNINDITTTNRNNYEQYYNNSNNQNSQNNSKQTYNNNDNLNQSNRIRDSYSNHQKKESQDSFIINNEYSQNNSGNQSLSYNNNNLQSNSKNYYPQTPSQKETPQSNNYRQQHYQNNNYYEEIYMNYSKNDSQPKPFNIYNNKSAIENNNNNYNLQNQNNVNMPSNGNQFGSKQQQKYQTRNESFDKSYPIKNNPIIQNDDICFKPIQKPALTFPSNQNYENNHQQIRQIEQILTNLNLEKQQLEAQMLKLPIHQKNAQQRIQKHTIEKQLETIEKDIYSNRKQLKQLQNI